MRAVAMILAAAAYVASAIRDPVFGQQWTSVVTQSVAINQGGQPGADGSLCCDYTSPGCKVQTIYMGGRQYYDLAANRTAFYSTEGGGVVTLWSEGKEYSVDENNDCQSWCPTEDGPQPFGLQANVTAASATTYNGKACDEYTVPTVIPILNATMSTDYWYVVLNGANGPDTPLADLTDLTPFGEPMGTQSSVYSDFTYGVPDAKYFVVNNKASCKQAKGCNGSSSSQGNDKDGIARVLTERGVKLPGHARTSPLVAELFKLEA